MGESSLILRDDEDVRQARVWNAYLSHLISDVLEFGVEMISQPVPQQV